MSTIARGLLTLLATGIVAGTATTVHAEPAALWSRLGCADCHGEGGFYRDKIKGAVGKPVDSVARWIQNAPSIKPDTIMPSFQGAIGDEDARALAAWVQQRAAELR